MKRLLMTTMLILPIGAGTAFAQGATVPPGQEQSQNDGAAAVVETEQSQAEQPEAEQPETEQPQTEQTQTEQPQAEQTQGEQPAADPIVREQAPNELRVDWITGTTVTSPDGETIGNVNDLILDVETGQMSAAILSVGGFLGIGAKQIAVAWSDLQIDYDANQISLPLTREEADAAPEYIFRQQEQLPAPATGMGAGGVTETAPGMGGGAGGVTVPAQGMGEGAGGATEPETPAR